METCNGFFSCLTEAIINTIYASIICSAGFALGFAVTGLLVHEKSLNNDNSDEDSESEDEEEEESESTKYCKKYWDAYKKLDDRELSDQDISNIEKSIVIDTLPFYGGIHMLYNKEYSGFNYYNDRGANIPYKMLATVARKYVTTFNCKNLYINLVNELEKSKQVLEEVERRIKDPTEKEMEESVFASLKKVKEKGLSNTKKAQYLIKGNFIKFKYMGKISDVEVFKKTKEDENNENDENKSSSKMIDFATFKNMFSSSTANKDKDV